MEKMMKMKSKNKEANETLQLLDKMFSKSRLTEEDALELGAKINKGLAKRYLEMEKAMRHAKNSS